MDKELAQRWVDALESGKYKQGQGCLRTTNDEYCCIGVLCDLIDSAKWKENGDDWIAWGAYGSIGLPYIEHLGFEGDPEVLFNPIVANRALSEWNDSGKSFKEIAELIRKEYLDG